MSGRIRSMKPEWLEDELLTACSDAARVLSAGLILLADDYGNGRAGELYLAPRVFPGKPVSKTRAALKELVAIRYVILYEADGQRYFSVRNWTKHQKVQHPGKPLVPKYATSTEERKSDSGVSPEREQVPKKVSGDSHEGFSVPDATLAPDLDQRPTTTTADAPAVVDPEAMIRCPVPLPLDDGTFAGLQVDVGLTREIAEPCLRNWARTQAATSQTRKLDTWISWGLTVLRGRWSNDKAALRAEAAAGAPEAAERTGEHLRTAADILAARRKGAA